jgi:hypothetical protein
VGAGGGGKERKMASHELAQTSDMISSSEGDARVLESESPFSPPPGTSIHIWSCSWVLLLGPFQERELDKARGREGSW